MKDEAQLIRVYDEEKNLVTLGHLTIYSAECDVKLHCKTVELPWKENKFRVSCIPEGRYEVVRRWSKKYGNHFWVKDVPSRDLILIHVANYTRDLLGCIGVGKTHKDIDKDGIIDVTDSRKEMDKMLEVMTEPFWLEIIGFNNLPNN
jgi:hypothetical protein